MAIKKISSFTPLFEGVEGQEESYRPLLTYSDLRALIRDVVQETVEETVQRYFEKTIEERKTVKEANLAEKEWLTQKEVCMFFGVSKETVIKWEKRQLVSGRKEGKHKLYKRTEIENLPAQSYRSTYRVNEFKPGSPYRKSIRKKYGYQGYT